MLNIYGLATYCVHSKSEYRKPDVGQKRRVRLRWRGRKRGKWSPITWEKAGRQKCGEIGCHSQKPSLTAFVFSVFFFHQPSFDRLSSIKWDWWKHSHRVFFVSHWTTKEVRQFGFKMLRVIPRLTLVILRAQLTKHSESRAESSETCILCTSDIPTCRVDLKNESQVCLFSRWGYLCLAKLALQRRIVPDKSST